MDSEFLKVYLVLFIWASAANFIAIKKGFYSFSPETENARPYVQFRDVFGIFVLFLLIQLVLVPGGALLLNYYSTGDWTISSDFKAGWINVIAIVTSAVGIIGFCKYIEPQTVPIIATPSTAKFKSDVKWGACSWFLCFPIVSLFAMMMTRILNYLGVGGEIDQVAVRYLKDILSDRWLFLTSFWLIILVVPFVEETIFRGFLQTWLRQKMHRASAIATTSAIFAGFHFSPSQGWHNIDLLSALFLLSCFLGIIYEKRGSIWASIGLHMTFNAISEVFIVAQELSVSA